MPPLSTLAEQLVSDATCLGCGCACDDIEVVVGAGRIVQARGACELGAAWFGDGRAPARARMSGADAAPDDALDAAARLLVDASRPLVFLAPELSCQAQREGVALADALRAALDSVTSYGVLDGILAAQERGRAGATLGEVRHRADVVVCWGVDPQAHYPRYWSRFVPETAGLHLPEGRESRTVVAVDVGAAHGPADADRRFLLPVEDEVATLVALRSLVAHPDTAPADGERPEAAGVWARARALAPVLLAGRYVAIVVDGERGPHDDLPMGRDAALSALAQALNGPTRCALSTLRAGGNRSGADAVLTSQTGYPAAIDFSRGYPRYRAHDGRAPALLARREVDTVLVLGAGRLTPDAFVDALAGCRVVALGPGATEGPFAAAAVAIDGGTAGIHEGGTALRMDDVPLPLRPSLAGPPATADLAGALRQRVVAGRRRGGAGP